VTKEIDDLFADAVAADHAKTCNPACDIAAALRAGYPRVAAYLLMGATEAPVCAFVRQRYPQGFDRMGFGSADDPDWLGWCQWFDANTVKCGNCEVFNFTDQGYPRMCGNCLSPLPSLDVDLSGVQASEVQIRNVAKVRMRNVDAPGGITIRDVKG
jgi:hypothetical protein